jgi:hypothetical protein
VLVLHPLHGPAGQRTGVGKHGQTADGKQRVLWQNPAWTRHTLLLAYVEKGLLPAVQQPMVERAMHGRGIRDTARVRPSSPTTVIATFNKRASPTRHA